MVLDPGLARYWRHDGEPRSPRAEEPEEHDLQIVGPDAVAAGRAYDRQFDPRYLYDVADVDRARERFSTFAGEHGFDARAEVLPRRVPHTERARKALEIGHGLGVVMYNGLWAVAVGGLPAGVPLPVYGIRMPAGEFEGRWRSIDVVVDATATMDCSETVHGVMVEHGQLLCAGLEPLGHFRMWEPLDGLADYVFWGEDAGHLAAAVGARGLGQDVYGWRDVPVAEVGNLAGPVQERIERDSLHVCVDYRPHDNLERLNAQVRTRSLRAGTLVLDGHKACGFDNRWGDGIFPVIRDLDAGGREVRVRLDVGNEQMQSLMRRVRLRSMAALASRKIVDGGEPVRFAERLEPAGHPSDTGWVFTSGAETQVYCDDAGNLAVVQVEEMVQRAPGLARILDAPVGSAFRLEGNEFVPDV